MPSKYSTGTTVTDLLAVLLADTYTLGLKTQNYHWNVTGPQFAALHELFGKQYDELFEAVDELAERIRALDARAPGSLAAFASLTTVPEASGTEDAEKMLLSLADGHERVVATAHRVITAAEKANDPATADMATVRMEAHQKAAWMLNSSRSGR